MENYNVRLRVGNNFVDLQSTCYIRTRICITKTYEFNIKMSRTSKTLSRLLYFYDYYFSYFMIQLLRNCAQIKYKKQYFFMSKIVLSIVLV